MRYAVVLAEDAERDIADICAFIARHDSPAHARRVLDGLEDACASLARFPRRGNIPAELSGIGMSDYRETHFKPYRIIYRVAKGRVVVYCVLDGRRNVRDLLQMRLLR